MRRLLLASTMLALLSPAAAQVKPPTVPSMGINDLFPILPDGNVSISSKYVSPLVLFGYGDSIDHEWSGANMFDGPVTLPQGTVAEFLPVLPIEQFGGNADCGITDNLQAFNKAKAALTYTSGAGPSAGVIQFKNGCYFTSGTLDASGAPGLTIAGSGRASTVLKGTGNYPIVNGAGTALAPLNFVTVRDLNITCASLSNSNGHGVRYSYGNSNKVQNVSFYGCNHDLDMTGQYLTELSDNVMQGAGAQQQNYCLYANFPTDVNDTFGNNALIVHHNICQNAATASARLIDANGSLFDHNQWLGAPIGVDACNQPAATYPSTALANCEFMFFGQDQTDTTGTIGWRFTLGSGGAMGTGVVIQQPWVGNSHTAAISVDGGVGLQFNDVRIESADVGVIINNSSNIHVDGKIDLYNRANNGSQSVLLSGTTTNNVVNVETTTANPVAGAYNGIVETGSFSFNQFWAGPATCGLGVAFGGASTGVAYTFGPATPNQCSYEVHGREVVLQYFTTLSSVGSATGTATLTGLPVTPAPATGFGFSATDVTICSTGCSGLTGPILTQVNPASTIVNLYEQGTTGIGNLANTNFSATSTFFGKIEYLKQ